MRLPEAWQTVVGDEIKKPYFRELEQFLVNERKDHEVFPSDNCVFAALELTPPDATRVVILGQDPYHDVGQAHGLCFSVNAGTKIPGSLRNIFKELYDDLGCPIPKTGCLTPWAQQGVLLLNVVLTVRAHQAHSHKGKGWETFTDAVIEKLGTRSEPTIFVFWGNHAKAKQKHVDMSRHVVLASAHPSPLSAHAGFFGSRPFSKINQTLRTWGKPEIDWAIRDS